MLLVFYKASASWIASANVGGTESCAPFISQYTDCTEENMCSGCSKCVCKADGKWNCEEIHECPDQTEVDHNAGLLMEEDLDQALIELEKELLVQKKNNLEKERAKQASKGPPVPEPDSREEKHTKTKQQYIFDEQILNVSDEIIALISNDNGKYRSKGKPKFQLTDHGGFRYKRASDAEKRPKAKNTVKGNGTVTFHHTIDEINEDTLKNQNSSGTIKVHKVPASPQISRRTSLLTNSTSSAVEIGNTQEDGHRDDNKVDTTAIHDDKEDLLVHIKLHHVVGNYTQENKDKELSKILVNELKGGTSELIGEKGTPVISNITFYPENNTLTAMAFIAGNLLNKLWNMEKDASKDQIDTEMLKHEKITDLVELFKEPLNRQQEMFLKSALNKLSTAINQHENVDDISLCKNVEEIKKQLKKDNNNDEIDCDKDKEPVTINSIPGTAEALNKITGVLNLLNKYEKVQATLRTSNSGPINGSTATDVDKILTDVEKSSLGLYAKTLETITNLLVPKENSKKITDSLHSGNAFSTGIEVNKILSNFKIENLNVTSKDKIVLDYLEHIQSNPDCLLNKHKPVTPPSIEGDILLNLSEFFKIKSLSDLVRLIETEKPPTVPILRSYDDETTFKSEDETTTETIKLSKTSPQKLKETKENLKIHLKTIINDLTELKKAEGKGVPKDLQIMDALPCIYKLFNDNKDIWQEDNKDESIVKEKTLIENKSLLSSSSDDFKIKEIFVNLKNELKFAQTRRTNTINGQRPKSAVVWERVVKNAAVKINPKTRRNMSVRPKTIKELKDMIEKFESWGSNTYKNYAFLHEVPPSERLLLLKTFVVDTLRYIKALETIHSSLLDTSENQKDSLTELFDFIENTVMNLQLNERVVKNLNRKKYVKKIQKVLPKKLTKNKPLKEFKFSTDKQNLFSEKLTRYQIVNQDQNTHATMFNRDENIDQTKEQSTKLTKDQVINQLIKNRIASYIKTKEATGENKNNMNYDLAEKILTHLEIGNYQLARELYKIFANQKKTNTNKNKKGNKNPGISKQRINPPSRRKAVQVEPLIEFEDSKPIQMYQDQFMKQLLNLKNMN